MRVDPRAPQHRVTDARPYVAPMLHDPGVEVGPFRILPRADGMWILYDERQPFGRRTAGVAKTEVEATMLARVSMATASAVAALRGAK